MSKIASIPPSAAQDQISDIVAMLRAKLEGIQAIYLFGSHATGHATASSDIDIGVLLPRPMDNVDRWNLQQELSISGAGVDVDLVDLRAATTVFQTQIIATGQYLFVSDPLAVDYFEMYAYSDYARLNEERAEILSDLKKV